MDGENPACQCGGIAAGWRFFLHFLQKKYYPALDRQEARADGLEDREFQQQKENVSLIRRTALSCS
jgi:hypothetical protein